MRYYGLLALLLAVAPLTVAAQSEDVTDLSRYELLKEGESLTSLKRLQEMEDAYAALVAEEDCTAALPAIVAFHEAANKTANLLRQGNEPFYDAPRDDQKMVIADRPLMNTLIAAEQVSNTLVHRRNRAWVEEAKCLLHLGDREAAVLRLYRALDYIGTGFKERAMWEEARNLLWGEVGFIPGE